MSSEPGSSRDPLRAIYEEEQRRPRRSRLFTGAVTLLVMGAFALVVYYAYQLGLRAGAQGPAPLIKAEQQPYKVKPNEPGGMDVPNQDKLIYKEVKPAAAGPSAQPTERLMPEPESPMPKPAAEEPAKAQAAEAPAAAASAAVSSASAATPPATPSPAPAEGANPPKQEAPQQVAQGGGLESPSAPAKSGSSTEAASAPPAASPPSAAPAATASAAPATPAAPAKPAPAPAANASAEKTPKKIAARETGEWHVQLGAVRSAEEAQHEWARLQGKYPDLLGQLSLNIQRVDLGAGKGVFFRIRGGELQDRGQANALCDKLKALKVGCLAVRP